MNFKENETGKKLRGGYYTPSDLSHFLVRWIAEKEPKTLLEPSCGDGAFFSALKNFNVQAKTTAIEVDTDEVRKARARAQSLDLSKLTVKSGNFLEWATDAFKRAERFDAVVGNPPFIRYQYLPPIFQYYAEGIFRRLDCRFTKHTNAWVPFILASFELLKPKGRLAMVVPSEIIHVTHAQSLRSYLGREASRTIIIDPEEIWFEGTLQGAVLLFAEKKMRASEYSEGLGIYPVQGRSFTTENPSKIFANHQTVNGKTVEGKWTRALLSPSTRNLLDDLEERETIKRFHEFADVDVGIVTGANKFFLVKDEVVKRYKLEKWAHPMFGRSQHCPGVVYDEKQHLDNAENGIPTNFLWFQGQNIERCKMGQRYIEFGEEQNLHTRYKCRIRKPWYTVSSVYATEVGMLKRSHDTPRLIFNQLGAYTTDTAYRIRTLACTAKQLVFGFVNGLTALSAELEGRHYGGGVLELVPSEIEKLLMPCVSNLETDISGLDNNVRSKPMSSVLEKQSRNVLGSIGLIHSEQDELLSGWQRLRNRRHRVSYEITG